ncbi:hypothetical protein MS3_00004855 [Schistosoma haematobium]|uniref:Uncharacterized protein n=1 Tax=Schistosoma haematobium TaxID=6185 RepID=A0A922ISX9_SCHHA|nr:hypothetical protein MS3_00004855 [Schistosoma haematobium]KAH9586921.1 hypothetical protein MS3_00004855 [Schistosoma haematobium]
MVEDTRRLLVSDDRFLRNIARVFWDHWVSNSEVGCKVLGNDGKSVDDVNLHQLRRLGHVLRMLNHRLPRHAMLISGGDVWKKVMGQTKSWHQSLKSLTSGVNIVGR